MKREKAHATHGYDDTNRTADTLDAIANSNAPSSPTSASLYTPATSTTNSNHATRNHHQPIIRSTRASRTGKNITHSTSNVIPKILYCSCIRDVRDNGAP